MYLICAHSTRRTNAMKGLCLWLGTGVHDIVDNYICTHHKKNRYVAWIICSKIQWTTCGPSHVPQLLLGHQLMEGRVVYVFADSHGARCVWIIEESSCVHMRHSSIIWPTSSEFSSTWTSSLGPEKSSWFVWLNTCSHCMLHCSECDGFTNLHHNMNTQNVSLQTITSASVGSTWPTGFDSMICIHASLFWVCSPDTFITSLHLSSWLNCSSLSLPCLLTSCTLDDFTLIEHIHMSLELNLMVWDLNALISRVTFLWSWYANLWHLFGLWDLMMCLIHWFMISIVPKVVDLMVMFVELCFCS